MQKQLLGGLCLLAIIAWEDVGAVPIAGLYNTGVNDAGEVLPLHAIDPHYELTGAASEAYVAPVVYHSPGSQAWVSAPAGSAWIGPNRTDSTWPLDPLGVYYYTLRVTFDLTGTDPSTARISGDWASDNTAQLFLNGEDTGFAKGAWGFNRLEHFTLVGGFVQGINILEFRVVNTESTLNPSGLLVANLVGRVGETGGGNGDPDPSAVPEGTSTLVLLVGGMVLLSFCSLGLKAGREAREQITQVLVDVNPLHQPHSSE